MANGGAIGAKPQPKRKYMKILVAGYNGCGKSTMINSWTDMTLAEVHVEAAYDPIIHRLTEEHPIVYEGVPIRIYDTRGFGDIKLPINEKNMKAVMDKIDKLDVVLISHKLYDRVDECTMNLLNVLSLYLGNALMERAIIVFTFGDDFITQVNPGQIAKDEMIKMQGQKLNAIKIY